MGLVRITSWYPNFNGSYFGLPPSEIHRMTGLPPKSCELWRIRTGPIAKPFGQKEPRTTYTYFPTISLFPFACHISFSSLTLRTRAHTHTCSQAHTLTVKDSVLRDNNSDTAKKRHPLRTFTYASSVLLEVSHAAFMQSCNFMQPKLEMMEYSIGICCGQKSRTRMRTRTSRPFHCDSEAQFSETCLVSEFCSIAETYQRPHPYCCCMMHSFFEDISKKKKKLARLYGALSDG